jgi:hypothetical protein
MHKPMTVLKTRMIRARRSNWKAVRHCADLGRFAGFRARLTRRRPPLESTGCSQALQYNCRTRLISAPWLGETTGFRYAGLQVYAPSRMAQVVAPKRSVGSAVEGPYSVAGPSFSPGCGSLPQLGLTVVGPRQAHRVQYGGLPARRPGPRSRVATEVSS